MYIFAVLLIPDGIASLLKKRRRAEVEETPPERVKEVNREHQWRSSIGSARALQELRWYQAVSNVNLSIRAGDRHGILGANGAGKTTVFNLVCGVYPPTSGSVVLAGEDITAPVDQLPSAQGAGTYFSDPESASRDDSARERDSGHCYG